MKKPILAAALAVLSLPAAAQEVTVKLGTLAPLGSSWHETLKELAERWSEASGGKVRLRIYPGGTQGNEGEMVRKMAVGQLQAASITAVGMHDILAEPQAMSVPLMFSDRAEMEHVFQAVQPRLDAALEKKGYVALQWSTVGAIKFFCTKAYRSPSEMGDAKVFAWEGDPGSVQAWRAAGFRPVVLSSTDTVPSLQTGMINCIASVPLYVLTARLFEKASHMMDVSWGYLVGATLVRKDAWERIAPDVRPRLLAAARELGKQIDAEVDKLNDDAVAAMKKQGLDVMEVDASGWRAAGEKAWPVIRGKVIPAAFFDLVRQERDAYRAANARK